MSKEFPAWRYGPNGQSAIFDAESEVPNGWEDHPSKVDGGAHPDIGAGNQPQTAEQYQTAFGAGREDVESTSYDDKSLEELRALCGEREIDYHPNARETKLRALLAAHDVAAPKSED